jgi:hypothetical protein
MIAFEETRLNGQAVPLVWRITAGRDAGVADIREWLADHEELYNERLDRDGAVLIRGFEHLRSAEDFEAVLRMLRGELLDYVGGSSPRRVVHGRIMTATEAPPVYSIPLHQEMSYTAHAPERISFFCVTPASQGGETTVADMRTVTTRIGHDLIERFKRKGGLQLRRNLPLPDKAEGRPGVPKPWTDVFDTTDRDVADRTARARGWRTEWLADGSVQLWQEVLPATRVHPRTGEELWFNQIHIFDPAAAHAWALRDGRFEYASRLETALQTCPHLLDRIEHADGSPLDADDVAHVAEVMVAAETPVPWRSGDLLMLDNMLAGHGRRPYGGQRLVLTALLNGCRQPIAALA